MWKNRASLTRRSSPVSAVNLAFFHSVKAISPAKLLVTMVSFSILALSLVICSLVYLAYSHRSEKLIPSSHHCLKVLDKM